MPLKSQGEDLACQLLLKKGFKIFERNYRLKFGEIDIIAFNKKTLVFVEVKTRSNKKYGEPFEAVNISKQKRLKKLADSFIAFHKPQAESFRFDVIGILVNEDRTEIIHIENAF